MTEVKITRNTIDPVGLANILPVLIDMDKPMYLEGPAGVGKTEIMKQKADELGFVMIDEPLSQADALTLRGVMVPDLTGDEPVTVETQPALIRKCWEAHRETGKPVFLFLDELASALPSTRTAALKLVQDRALGSFELPPGTYIAAAGNTANDAALVYDLEGPLANRFAVFSFVPSFDAWEEWAFANDINPGVLGALKYAPEFLYTPKVEAGAYQFPSPRQWEAVSDFMYKSEGNHGINRLAVIASLVGDAAAFRMEAILQVIDELTPADVVLRDPKGSRVPAEDRADARYIQALMVSNNLTKDNIEAGVDYLERLGKVFMTLAFVALGKRDPKVLISSERARKLGGEAMRQAHDA